MLSTKHKSLNFSFVVPIRFYINCNYNKHRNIRQYYNLLFKFLISQTGFKKRFLNYISEF